MTQQGIGDLHWLFGILQNVDVGLVVLDRNYRVQLWNGFMENHSGVGAGEVLGQDLFSRFPDIPEPWLKRKLDAVFLLKHRAFSTWHQRPYLMRFDSYRPITGGAEWMYQNVTVFPLMSVNGKVDNVCLMIYDVTDTAQDELALQRANAELEQLGRTDGLTGLNNRRAWEELLVAEFKRHRRSKAPGVLVMFDIDHFKRVNDTYGHQAGDEVIRTVARTLTATKRDSDFAGRYGGEEFGVILADTDTEGGRRFCERLREAIAGILVRYDSHEIRFTISLGVAPMADHLTSHTEWLERADQALYQSKEGGRNRVTVYGAAEGVAAGDEHTA